MSESQVWKHPDLNPPIITRFHRYFASAYLEASRPIFWLRWPLRPSRRGFLVVPPRMFRGKGFDSLPVFDWFPARCECWSVFDRVFCIDPWFEFVFYLFFPSDTSADCGVSCCLDHRILSYWWGLCKKKKFL